MGRRKKNLKINKNNRFRQLDQIYTENIENDMLVAALNSLNQIERNLMIVYIDCDSKLVNFAARMHCSTHLARKILRPIKEKIKNNYNKILNDNN